MRRTQRVLVILVASLGWGCSRSNVHSAAPMVIPTITLEPSRPPVFKAEYEKRLGAIRADPDSTKARGEFALFLHANDYVEEAAVLYRELHEKDRPEARWAYLLSRILQDQGDVERARTMLDSVGVRAPGYPLLPLRRAEMHFKSGQWEEAGREYRNHLAGDPGSVHARLGLARLAIDRQAWADAEAHLLEATQIDPKFSSCQALLVTVYEALGRPDQAEKWRRHGGATYRYREPDDPWLDALNDHCFDVERLSVLADIQVETGRIGRGIELLQRSRQIDPKRARTALELAKAFLKTADRVSALPLLHEAVLLEATLEDAHFALVGELQDAGDTATARIASDLAVRLNPRSAGLKRQRGTLLQAAGRFGEAEAALQQAIDLDPTDVRNFESMGNFFWARERRAEAAVRFEQARGLSRLAAKPRVMLAGYYINAGKLSLAGEVLAEAEEIEPNLDGLAEVRALYELRVGNGLVRAGNLPDAEQAYLRGLKSKPDHQESVTNLVALQLRSGRLEEARERLARFIDQFPKAVFAWQLAARVELQSGNRAAARNLLERGLRVARAESDRAEEQALLRLLEQLRPP